MGVTSLGRHTRPACNQALLAMYWLKRLMLTSIQCVFLDFGVVRGLGLLFMTCACAIALRENRLTGMRGTWGVVWRTAHVPTIPFTWLRRANAWAPTAHASNYQALFSLKLCKQCGFNSCVRVLYSMGSRERLCPNMGICDVNGVTWSKYSILIGRQNFCCALIGYSLKGPYALLVNNE